MKKFLLNKSRGMLLTDFWKKMMFKAFKTIYGDRLDDDKLRWYIDIKCPKFTNGGIFRDLYRNKTIAKDGINDILQIVEKEGLIIGASGVFLYNQKKLVAFSTALINIWGTLRKKFKKIELIAEGLGEWFKARHNHNCQLYTKSNMNSLYGASAVAGFFSGSPDSTPVITAQSREMISEVLWAVEKVLAKNMAFLNLDEFILYVTNIVEEEYFIEDVERYNIYDPNEVDIRRRLDELINCILDKSKETITNEFVDNLVYNVMASKSKRINFFYKYNLFEFFDLNNKVFDIINGIMRTPIELYTTEFEKMAENGTSIFIEPLTELSRMIDNFVVSDMCTQDRVWKYLNCVRHCVVASDTDSVLFELDTFSKFVSVKSGLNFDTFDDENPTFKAINIGIFFMNEVINFKAKNMGVKSYVMMEHLKELNFKNEYIFKSILLYSKTKKNYSALLRVREGELIEKIANTGLLLSGSSINSKVGDAIDDLIKTHVHYSRDLNQFNIIRAVYDIEKLIYNEVYVVKNPKIGIDSSFKTVTGLAEDGLMSRYVIRGVLIWNWLNPDNIIQNYTKVSLFNTKLEKESDCEMIKDPIMREKIRDVLFTNPRDPALARYGLRTIVVPDNVFQTPDWILDVVDYNKLKERHMSPIISLLPSLGINLSRVSSNRKILSPLVTL